MDAIIHANILTMNGKVFKDGMLLIKDGKIDYVGKMDQSKILSNLKVVDAQGCLLTPGLIDVHTHLGIDEEGLQWEGADYNETSEVSTPHMRAIDGINPYDQGFIDAAEAGVTTIQVLPGSANVIGGQMAILKVKPNHTLDEMLIKEPSGLKIAFGENPKKFHGQHGRAPVTRMGIAAILREQFVSAQNYIEKQKVGNAERDLKLEILALALKREIPVRAHAHRADDIMTAIRIAKEFNLDLTIEHATEGHKIPKQIADSLFKVAVGPTLSSRSKVELKEIGWDTYQVLAENGIPFSIITDHPVVPIQYLSTSAMLAIKAGVHEEIVWQGLTVNPASHLGLQNRIGVLEKGKDADLVLWNKDPLIEGGKPLITIVDGEIVYQKESTNGIKY